MPDVECAPTTGASDDLLRGLTPAQRAAVTSEAGTLCVVAGAGSGKTTVLTRRLAHRVRAGTAEPEHALVVTFTRKAAGELRRRLARLGADGVWAGTFHAAAYAQLRQHWADHGRPAPAVIGDGRRIMREVVARQAGVDQGATEVLATEAGWARARLVEPGDYAAAAVAAGRTPGLDVEHVAEILEEYRREKVQRRALDVDDLVSECLRMLQGDGARAAAVRWRFRHLFVDEFQDVNPAQWGLLQQWHHGRDDLCVVGDPRQAIYGWNGSDPTLLERLPSLLPGTVTLHLDENRRSSPQVVAAATAVLASPGTGDSAPELSAGAADGPAPVVAGFDDEATEAAAVARWLRRTRRPGQPWHRHAVLARTNARLDAVARALRDSGIPVRRAGRRGPGSDVARLAGLLQRLNPGTPLPAGLVDARAEIEDAPGAPVAAGAGGAPAGAADLLDRLFDEYLADAGNDEGRGATVGAFVSWLAASPETSELAPALDGVELATFHRAKGLEWRAVAVVGLEDGTLPIVHATTAAARAEERRLFYVALTRAESELWCSWAARTGEPGRERDRRPSRYLDAVRGSASSAEPTAPDLAATHLSELRGRLAQATSTNTGAWSEGCLPLRALRSINA